MTRWNQFVAMFMAQLSGRSSLRDIVANLATHPHKLYHLGIGSVTRSSLARVNEEQPYRLYERMFERVLARCQRSAPGHGFRFKSKLYSLDASTVDLCLSMFPWAKFKQTKGAVKSFVGTSRNAVLTQLWIAMCVYLLLSYIKFVNRLSWSLYEILRVLQLNLFDRRPMMDLLETQSTPPDPPPQLGLKFT